LADAVGLIGPEIIATCAVVPGLAKTIPVKSKWNELGSLALADTLGDNTATSDPKVSVNEGVQFHSPGGKAFPGESKDPSVFDWVTFMGDHRNLEEGGVRVRWKGKGRKLKSERVKGTLAGPKPGAYMSQEEPKSTD
jgi:hypothetical protein